MSISHNIRNILCTILLLNVLITIVYGGFACLKDPCLHGICIDDLNRPHQCYCQNGFTGYSCEQNWDECRSWGPSPCLNGGTCLDGIASFNCSCPEPFAGRLCEINLSNCGEVFPCQNNGTCAYNSASTHKTGLMCYCLPGFTGLHCEKDVSVCNETVNACHNGGKCVDGIGKKYHCQCAVGWEGFHCELPVDECTSSPCQNGGICVDKIADFSCACPFGYTGKACETKLEICEENPCLNGAFCLQEGNKRVCYCVPDFHGELCEEQYDECDPPDKCSNGGTCIDGVGTFTCSCPPDFFGPVCQCTPGNDTSECMEYAGKNQTVSTPPPEDTNDLSILPTMEYSSTVVTISEPHAVSSRYVPLGVTPLPIPFSSSLLMSSDSPYDPGGDSASIISPSLSSSISPGYDEDDSSSTTTMGLGIPPVPSPTLSPVITTFVEDTADVDKTDTYDPCPSLSIDESASFTPEVAVTTTREELMSWSSMSPSIGWSSSVIVSLEFPVSDLFSSGLGDASSTISISSIDPNELISEFPPDMVTPTPTLLGPIPTASFSSELWEVPDSYSSYYDASTLFLIDSSSLLYPSESLSAQLESPTLPPGMASSTLVLSSPSIIIGSQGEPRLESLSPDSSSYQQEAFSSTMGLAASFPTPTVPDSSIGAIFPVGTAPLATSPVKSFLEPTVSPSEFDGRMTSRIYDTPVVTTPVPSESIKATTSTVEEIIVMPTPVPTQSIPKATGAPNLTDPCENYCHNNAKCISTTIEPICICQFRNMGERCEQVQEKVNIPSFSGNSFLKYELPRASANIIDISSQMATVVPEGILMYSAIGKIYALIYIQDGLVTLHFSCGAQSMHFVETRTRVDNGYNFTLSFRLQNTLEENGELRCTGEVSLNESYSMRGEQTVDIHALSVMEQPIKRVFLGGLDNPDSYSNDDIIRITPGFRGCVYHLKVNQELVSMFEDAKDGREISECSTFGCVVNPCVGNSRCVSSIKYPFWECICPPGFAGVRCNIRACSVNPCKKGATCTSVQNAVSANGGNQSVTWKCLCPLGFTGNLCQSEINVKKPSFHGTPDYSSFLAYDSIPRFADWMQLKFHFITHNMSQIALLMFSGSETERVSRQNLESPPVQVQDSVQAMDFFSISFLQGFIALTWNLGSGTQRITTPSRIDNRINVHTLFAGRNGRQAWLKVDGMRNITGKSPGRYLRLDALSDLFVGGHEIPRFEGLPHDIPLHTGFQGCIFDLGFRLKNKLFLPKPLRGRNVKNCYDEDC
ncbi:unnamed protein product [Allacma fusca]|uniref:Protein eyes shut n=1 Tax=Allacma fusca TaxID=39272 RepID=A0A8J2LHP0_9HEXA|nr:unnamed protein product [Allacma fusca]